MKEPKVPHVEYELTSASTDVENSRRFCNLRSADRIHLAIAEKALGHQPTQRVPPVVCVSGPLVPEKDFQPIILVKGIITFRVILTQVGRHIHELEAPAF